MRFKFLVILGLLLAFTATDVACSKKKKNKAKQTPTPTPTLTPSAGPSPAASPIFYGSTKAGAVAIAAADKSLDAASALVGSSGQAQTGGGLKQSAATAGGRVNTDEDSGGTRMGLSGSQAPQVAAKGVVDGGKSQSNQASPSNSGAGGSGSNSLSGSASAGTSSSGGTHAPDQQSAGGSDAYKGGGGGTGGSGAVAGGLDMGGGLTGGGGGGPQDSQIAFERGMTQGARGGDNPMGTEDPDDYLNRIDINANIFKQVERKYSEKAQVWAVQELKGAITPPPPSKH